MPAASSSPIAPPVDQLVGIATAVGDDQVAPLSLLEQVADPRKPRGVRHRLTAMLGLALCAILAGARTQGSVIEAIEIIEVVEAHSARRSRTPDPSFRAYRSPSGCIVMLDLNHRRSDEDTRVHATEMFLIRHKRMHAYVERLTEGLSEGQIRESVHPVVNPLAWLLWHIARTEDSAINLLICDGAQVLDDAWCARLNSARRDAGTGMTMDQVIDLSTHVHLPSLVAYWGAVGERTAELVASLRPSELDEVVGPERVHDFLVQTTAEPARAALEKLFQSTTRGYFLVFLPLTHNYEHIGQADLIRGLLGRPYPF